MTAVLMVAGCGALPEDVCQVERVTSALVRGYSNTGYLGISEAQRSAVVDIRIERPNGNRDLCSGIIVAPDGVLTAAHCVQDDVMMVTVRNHTWRRSVEVEFFVEVSPIQDVALVHLPGLGASTQVTASDEDAMKLRGHLVELAGAGLRDDGPPGTTRFAVAEVLEVDERYLQVQLPQTGGPCGGDSGGPLLVRGPSGRIEVAGVLSHGDPDCDGPDRYERLDILASWLAARIDVADSNPAVCGALTLRGRCFGSRAVWCDGLEVRAEDCSDCGWSQKVQAFRCVAAEGDPCLGVSDTGECLNGVALRCLDGNLERLDCESCGGTCQLSARSGNAVCALSQEVIQ